MIDLRSDTVTKPTPGMRKAMAEAEVGDDVFKEDPTVNAFQKKISERFGMEAGLFVPSGTMGNQLALNLLTRPCDEVITDKLSHLFNYESAAAGLISSVQLHTLESENGILDAGRIRLGVRNKNDWDPRTSVIALENSANKGGGTCYSREALLDIRKMAEVENLYVHLDGARIWNAALATDTDLEFFGKTADTLSVCFSKGLGAPVGSMLLGSKELISRGYRMRKVLGGGMRQVGILAAAAEYAVDNHYPLLAEDHRRARQLADVIGELDPFEIDPEAVVTNIVLFDVKNGSTDPVLAELAGHGIHMVPFGPRTIRATFHFEVGDRDLESLLQIFRELYG
ncbi:MAG: GntG family PLP-dependent aldolase [Balneolales bacterium]